MSHTYEPIINVSVTFRHTESTEALKKYATEKILHCLKKFLTHDANVHIILDVEKLNHIAEVVVVSKGHDLMSKEVTGDLYSSIDALADSVEQQLRKQKDKQITKSHRAA